MDNAALRFLERDHSPQHAAHDSLADQRVQGTGDWIFTHADFQAWSHEENSLLLLNGDPGTGKTFLCSAIIDDLRRRHSSDESTAVLYFYFSANDHRRVGDQSLLSSLLFQMCSLSKAIPEKLIMLSDFAGGRQPSFQLLFRAVAVAVQSFRQIFIVIDALDECSDSRRLKATLRGMMNWDLDKLHLFLSSRPFGSIQAFIQEIGRSRYIFTTESNHRDVQAFIHRELSQTTDDFNMAEALAMRVASNAAGSFLWTTIILGHLSKAIINGLSKVACIELLQSLPKNLSDLYSRVIKVRSISAATIVRDRRVLIWAGYACRPLQVEEVAEAVAIDETAVPIDLPKNRLFPRRMVLNIWPELTRTVMIHTASGSHEAVTLVHASLREYMDEKLQSWNPHAEMARVCLRYLCLLDRPDTLQSRDFRGRFPLADYAARFWHYHMREVDNLIHGHIHHDIAPVLRAASDFFRGPSNICLQNWVKLFNPDQPWILEPDLSTDVPSVSTPLYYASCLGLTSLVRDLLQSGNGGDINNPNKNVLHGTALQAAAYHGHVAIVKLLLDFGADPSIRSGLYHTALKAAKFVGHEEVAKLLRTKLLELRAGEAGQDGEVLDLPQHVELSMREDDPYRWCAVLGSGRFGNVDKVESRASGVYCARKTIYKHLLSENGKQRVFDSVRLLAMLDHVHVINVLGSYSTEREFHILMEPIATWNLKEYMAGEKDAVPDPRSLTRWIGCLARGLAFLHRKGIKHKDIKPPNFLVDGDNILYTDFDLAHTFHNPNDATTGQTHHTAAYSAPEVTSGGERTASTDIFSLGCVYVEMLTVISGKRVHDIFQKSPDDNGYDYRAANNAAAVIWVEGLSFGGNHEKYREAVQLAKRMISQERPDAMTVSGDLGSLACNACARL